MIGEAAALGAALCWAVGSHMWAGIGRGTQLAPGALNLAKCSAASVLFGGTALIVNGRLVPHVTGTPAASLVLSGIVGLTFGDAAYFGSMAILGVRRALLLLSTAPVFAAVGGALWLDEPMKGWQLAAIAIALGGVAVVVNEQRAPGVVVRGSAPVGVALGLCAGIGQAGGSLLSRNGMAGGLSALDAALVRLPAGLLGIVVLAAVTGRLGPWTRSIARPRLLAAIGAAAFVGTYLGIWLSQVAIGRARSTAVAATLLATSPLFALPLGRWLEREPVSARAAAGTLVACTGVAWLLLGKA
jgi:drug/metabolite transporter (DMT)-like permease